MAKRNVLQISKLEDLKKWLVKDGWELLPLSNNPYEVLRASKAGKHNPLIIYSGKSNEHLSFADRDIPVIGAFIRDQKKPQTNADWIRSMTDKELASVVMCPADITGGDTECNQHHNCNECTFDWLQRESEG